MELVPGRRRNGGGYQSPSSREDDPAEEHHPSQLELESSNIRRAAAAATTTALDLLPISSSTAVVGVGLSVPGHPPPSTSSSASSSPTASGAAEAGPDPTAAQAQPQQPPAAAVEKEHMFDKVVTPSDVGKLNRLVIPKQHAERYFPLDPTANERGLLLSFEDRDGKSWRFRYSYWNSSQSYVMTKGWSRFVKDKRLDAGDTVSFSRAAEGAGPRDRLFIDWKRRPQPPPPPSLPHHLLQQYFYDHHHHHHQLSSYMGRPAQSGSNFFLPPFSSGANYSSMVSFARGSSNPPPPAAATAAWSRLFAPSIGPPPSAYPSTSTIPYDDNYSNSYYQQLHRRNSYGHNAANPYLYMRPPSGSSGVPSPTASSSQLYGGVPQMEYYSSGSSMSGMLAGSSSSSINAGWVVDRHQAIVSDPPPVSEQENSPIVAAAASKRVRLFGVNLNDDSERELVEGVRLHPFAGYPPQLGSSQMQQVRPMLPPFLPLQLSLGSPGGVSSSSAVNDATRVESPGRDDEHNPMSLDLDD